MTKHNASVFNSPALLIRRALIIKRANEGSLSTMTKEELLEFTRKFLPNALPESIRGRVSEMKKSGILINSGGQISLTDKGIHKALDENLK